MTTLDPLRIPSVESGSPVGRSVSMVGT